MDKDIFNSLEDVKDEVIVDDDINAILDTIYSLSHIRDIEGEDTPSYCFAHDITDIFGLSDEEVKDIALENGYNVFNVLPNEEVDGGLIIADKDCSKDLIVKDYEKFFGVDIDVEDIVEDDRETVEKDVEQEVEDEVVEESKQLNESSWTIGTFETTDGDNRIVAEYRWNKGYQGGSYEVTVGKFKNGMQNGPLFFQAHYPTEDRAKASFNRQVKKLKAEYGDGELTHSEESKLNRLVKVNEGLKESKETKKKKVLMMADDLSQANATVPTGCIFEFTTTDDKIREFAKKYFSGEWNNDTLKKDYNGRVVKDFDIDDDYNKYTDFSIDKNKDETSTLTLKDYNGENKDKQYKLDLVIGEQEILTDSDLDESVGSATMHIGVPVTMNKDKFKKFPSVNSMNRHKNSDNGYRYQYYDVPKDEFKALRKQGNSNIKAFSKLQDNGKAIEEARSKALTVDKVNNYVKSCMDKIKMLELVNESEDSITYKLSDTAISKIDDKYKTFKTEVAPDLNILCNFNDYDEEGIEVEFLSAMDFSTEDIDSLYVETMKDLGKVKSLINSTFTEENWLENDTWENNLDESKQTKTYSTAKEMIKDILGE